MSQSMTDGERLVGLYKIAGEIQYLIRFHESKMAVLQAQLNEDVNKEINLIHKALESKSQAEASKDAPQAQGDSA